MATTPAPTPEAQASISPVGRLFGVLFSPGKTFEDVVRKPSWVLPAIVLVVLSLLASALLSQRVNWRDVISQQIEKSPQAAQLSADQKAQRIEMGAKFAPIIAYVGGLVGPVILLLVVGLVMWGAYSVFADVNPGFEKSFAITAHSAMTALLSTPLFILILFLKPFGTVDVENPMATNLAAFMPDGAAKWLFTLGKQIDIFTIWTLILLGIGFGAVNPKKLRTGKSVVIAFSVWIAYVVARTGLAWVFS